MTTAGGVPAEAGARERAAAVDAELLRRVAVADRQAFETLYQRYHNPLFAYIFRLTRRAELVEEVLNDVMLAVWTGAPRFAGRSRPSTWIFGIGHHQTMKALRRLRTAAAEPGRARDGGDGGWPEPVALEGPESLLGRRELNTTLGHALARLSPE